MLNTFYVGIDVSKSNNSIFVMDSCGDKVFRKTIANSSLATSSFLNDLCKLDDASSSFFHFGLEATGKYGEHLAMFIRQSDAIDSKRKSVHVLNAKQVKRFKDSYPEIPKTDSIDAFVIADCLRFGRIGQKGTFMDDVFYALKHLTRLRFQYSHDLTREKNRYLNTLFMKFSTMAQLQASSDKLFSDTYGNTAMNLVNDFYSVDEIAYADIETLAEYLQKHSKNHFADPIALSNEIQKAARSSYQLPRTVQDSVNQVLAIQTNMIRLFEKQLKDIDKLIKKQIEVLPQKNILLSIPGIGPVYAAGIISEIGDISRFDNDAALAKYAGLSWNANQSGSFIADNTPVIQSGNRYFRYYLLEATNKIRLHEPEIGDFYSKKYAETQKTPHKRALVLTARKVVRLLYSLLKNNRLYARTI